MIRCKNYFLFLYFFKSLKNVGPLKTMIFLLNKIPTCVPKPIIVKINPEDEIF